MAPLKCCLNCQWSTQGHSIRSHPFSYFYQWYRTVRERASQQPIFDTMITQEMVFPWKHNVVNPQKDLTPRQTQCIPNCSIVTRDTCTQCTMYRQYIWQHHHHGTTRLHLTHCLVSIIDSTLSRSITNYSRGIVYKRNKSILPTQ